MLEVYVAGDKVGGDGMSGKGGNVGEIVGAAGSVGDNDGLGVGSGVGL